MWISPRFNALFVHCPKTAGSSIREVFKALDPGFIQFANHHLIASVGREFISEETWNKLFKFSVSRHPCDQLVSHYCNIIRRPDRNSCARAIQEGFSAWLRYKEDDPELGGVCARFIDLPMDLVMRFENLHGDFEILKGRLGLDATIELPRINVGDNRPYRWRDWFCQADLRYVSEQFSEDFSRFGYELPEGVDVARV